MLFSVMTTVPQCPQFQFVYMSQKLERKNSTTISAISVALCFLVIDIQLMLAKMGPAGCISLDPCKKQDHLLILNSRKNFVCSRMLDR